MFLGTPCFHFNVVLMSLFLCIFEPKLVKIMSCEEGRWCGLRGKKIRAEGKPGKCHTLSRLQRQREGHDALHSISPTPKLCAKPL
jgi:hypothetical protein